MSKEPPQYRTPQQRLERLEAWHGAYAIRLETIEKTIADLRALASNLEVWNANFEAKLNTIERQVKSKDAKND